MSAIRSTSRAPTSQFRRWPFLLALGLVGTIALTLGLLLGAVWVARSRLRDALGPHGEFDKVSLGMSRLSLRGVRIARPDAHWPTTEQLRANEVTIEIAPNLIGAEPRVIPKVTIDGLYIAIVRRRNRSIQVVPDLSERPRPAAADGGGQDPKRSLLIEDLELRDATLEFVDDSKARRVRLKLTQLHGHIRQLKYPGLELRSELKLSGFLPSNRSRGQVQVEGAMRFGALDGKLAIRGQRLDLKPFEPYLIKSTGTAIEQGTFDLTLSPLLHDRKVDAKGHLDIHGLKLSDGTSAGDSFLNMPRTAIVRALGGGDHTISTDVWVHGDLDDPKFSIEQSLLVEIGIGAAAALGVSVIGVVEGVGTLGIDGVEAVGNALSGGKK